MLRQATMLLSPRVGFHGRCIISAGHFPDRCTHRSTAAGHAGASTGVLTIRRLHLHSLAMHASTRSSVKIEVIDEEEFALEQQREIEEQSRKREEDRKRAATAAATAATAGTSSTAQAAPSGQTTGSQSLETRWLALLAPLSLPGFLSTLHDTRVYDPAAWARQTGPELAAFQRSAATGWKALLSALDALTQQERNAASQLRPVLTKLLCACIRFMLPPLPPTPSPLVPPELALDERDDDAMPRSLAEQAPPFEFVWQTPALTTMALQALQKLALIFRADAEASSTQLSFAAKPSASADVLDAAFSDVILQRFLAFALPTHLLPYLRGEMRSGTAPAPGSKEAALAKMHVAGADSETSLEWKGAQHFPAPFFVCFLCARLAPETLALHLRSLLPLLLPLMDDHELHLKVAGLAALQRIVRVVPAAHFSEGWGSLLLRSLHAALSFKEAPIVALAVPTYVQTHMALYPAILLHDYSVVGQLNQNAVNTFAPNSASKRGFPAPSSSSTASLSSLHERADAHDAMFSALMHEMSYLSLSPSLDNLFATFVYAQTLLPTMLYVGPQVLLRHTNALLPMLLQWCTSFVSPMQRRVCKLGWESVEALLSMAVLGERIAEAHMGRLIEACAAAWLTEEEYTTSMALSAEHAGRTPVRMSDAIPLSEAQFHRLYTSKRTIAHVMRLLRRAVPEQFQPLWTELQHMPELAGLAQELSKRDA